MNSEEKIDELFYEFMNLARKQALRENKAITLKQHDNASDSAFDLKIKFKKEIKNLVESERQSNG